MATPEPSLLTAVLQAAPPSVRRKLRHLLSEDPAEVAATAHLRYVNDDEPGIRRQPWGRGFTYFDAKGKRIQDKAVRALFRNPHPLPGPTSGFSGHRRPYPGHRARRRRSAVPSTMLGSGAQPGQVRAPGPSWLGAARRCGGSLTGTWRSGTFRGRVIALVIRLLDALYIRIGNPEYAERAYGRRRC
ncbi:MAG: hypothetical protein R2854_04080 [Caldilineaceae bacterium]